MTGTLRGPPQPYAFSSTPVLPQVLHCQSHHPHHPPPRAGLEPKGAPGSSCKLCEDQETAPSCSPINPACPIAACYPQNLPGAACTTCSHLLDLTFQPDYAGTLRFGDPDSLHLTDGDTGGD